jgi:GNAT superfamily N-acetyltransferase
MGHVIRQSLAGHEDGYLVLDERGGLAGHVFFGDTSKTVPHLGIGLADEYQNSGLGTVLLQFLIAVGRRKLRKRAIGLSVMKTNTRAVRVYEKCGFRVRGQCTFRSMNDSYLMELDFSASDREDVGRLDEHHRRVLGIPELRWTGEGISVFPMEERPAGREGGGWTAEVIALLRHGQCLVSAGGEILPRVRQIMSGVSIPEAVFGEEVRRELETAVCSCSPQLGSRDAPVPAWSSVFMSAAGSLQYRLEPDVRELSVEEARRFAGQADISAEGLCDASSGSGVRGLCRDGEIRACGWTAGPSGTGTLRVLAALAPGNEDPVDLESVLSPVVAGSQGRGLTAFAETQFDDIPLITALEGIGMRKYGDLFRIWWERGKD